MPVKFAELHNPRWLRQRIESGATADTIAHELNCGRTTARVALARVGLLPSPPRLGEPPPEPLEVATPANGDLAADVADDELSKRLREGLVGLSRLADLADRSTSDAMWDLVVGIDPATARAITFCAATLVSEQRKPPASAAARFR